MEEKIYYVYEYIRLDTNELFYVGKGHGNRWRVLHGRNSYFEHIINKYDVAVNILYTCENENIAFDVECWYINEYKYTIGYDLVNVVDGGEGCALVGENHPRYGKGYLIEGQNHPFYGKHHTEEFKNRLSEMSKGEGNNMYGKTHADETKKKIGMSAPNRKPIRCIELNMEFYSMEECIRYMKTTYKVPFSRGILKKYLDGNYHKEYYKEIEINGELVKLHWEYC